MDGKVEVQLVSEMVDDRMVEVKVGLSGVIDGVVKVVADEVIL